MVGSMDFMSMTHSSFSHNLSKKAESNQAIAAESSSSPVMKAAFSSHRLSGDLNIFERFTSMRTGSYHSNHTPWLGKKRMRLSVKVSLVLVLIVGIAAASVDYF